MFGLRESFVRAARRAAELPKLGARGWSSEAASGAKPKANQAASRLSALETETAEGHKLFENVRLPAEADAAMAGSGAGAGAGAAAAAGTAAAAAAGTRSTAARIANAAGNVIFLGGLGAAGYLGYYQYAYDVDSVETMVQETRKPENSFPGSSLWVEAMEKYVEWRRYFESEARKYADPPSECLLPDLPPNAKHVRTLVLDLDDVLVHSDWTRGRGWRTFKRPGVDAFLNSLSDYYELVVYTSQLPTYADPILDRLDPERTVQFRLYRDSTRYVDGHHVRDLSTLNRDPKQVLLITADPDAYSLQPDNAIKLKPWKLEDEDTTLLDLLPFLEAIVRTGVPDVRDVVRSYEGSDIPTAFRERMARVQESQAQTQRRGFFSSWSKRS